MDILIVHRYFWPDTPPYAAMLHSIAQRLSEDGHRVTVFTAQPSYTPASGVPRQPRRSQVDGFEVVRCPLLPESRRRTWSRVPNVGLFAGGVMAHILRRRRYDVVMAATMPPLAVAWAVETAGRLSGASFVYHTQDIYPEIAVTAGIMKEGPIFRLLRGLDARICTRAAAVVALSEDMATTHAERGVPAGRVRVIKGFDILEASDGAPVPEELAKPDGTFRVLFAGNIGRFQGLDTVLDAARVLAGRTHLRFDLLGDGVARRALIARAGDLTGRTVFFHGYHPSSVARRVMDSADLALVTLGPGVIRAAYPGKTLTCLAAGVPILAATDLDSELARMVRTERIGFSVAPGDHTAMASAVEYAIEHPDELAEMRDRVRRLFAARFGRQASLTQWSELMSAVACTRAGTPDRQPVRPGP